MRELARLLAELAPERVVVALPATLGATAAAQLLQALRPLGANALAITHADETDQLGVAVEAACRFGLAPEYMLDRGSRRRLAAAPDQPDCAGGEAAAMKFGRGELREVTSRWRCPSARENVTLLPAGGERIPARVLERGPDTLLVAIMVPTEPLSYSQLDGLMLEFVGPRGRVRLSGTVTHREPRRAGRAAHRPAALDRGAPGTRIRAHQVHAARRSSTADPDKIPVQSYTVDLSGGGFLLAGPDSLKIGDEVEFQLTLTPGVLLIGGKGKVVRVDAQSRRAVAFTVDQRARPPPADPLHLRVPARRTPARPGNGRSLWQLKRQRRPRPRSPPLRRWRRPRSRPRSPQRSPQSPRPTSRTQAGRQG